MHFEYQNKTTRDWIRINDKLVGGNSAHSFNPDAYFGHSWSYFDIQNLRLAILYFMHSSMLSLSDTTQTRVIGPTSIACGDRNEHHQA